MEKVNRWVVLGVCLLLAYKFLETFSQGDKQSILDLQEEVIKFDKYEIAKTKSVCGKLTHSRFLCCLKKLVKYEIQVFADLNFSLLVPSNLFNAHLDSFLAMKDISRGEYIAKFAYPN